MLCVITDYTVTDFCDFTLISVPSHDVCPFISLPIAGFVNASTEPYTRLPDSAQTQHGRQYPAAWQTGPTRISVPAVQELCREHCSILVQAAVPDDRFEVQNDPALIAVKNLRVLMQGKLLRRATTGVNGRIGSTL